jgi:hypothetical protein
MTETELGTAPLSGTVCIRKCSDIPDLAFLAAIDECCSLRTEPGGRYPYTMATRWDVAAILAGHREDVGGSPRDYPGVPEKVVMAKATKLDKRKLISGCGCGCRGDFEVTAKGRELQRAAREAAASVAGPDWDAMALDAVKAGFGTPSRMPELEAVRQHVLDAFGIPAALHARWAEIDRDSLRRFLPEPKPCRLYPSGTWIHSRPHTCPPHARG